MIKPKAILETVVRTPASDLKRIGKIMRLDHNEMTTPLDPEVVRAVLGAVEPEEIAAYPELEPLYKKLVNHLGIERGNILLFSGSDAGIKSLFEVYVEPADEVITLTPSYGMFFVYGRMFGAKVVSVGYQKDFSLRMESLVRAINPRTKLLLLANPNHTGTVILESGIRKIIETAARNEALVLIDEAYHEFYGKSVVALVDEYKNLVVSRTMSKAYGLAALRVGYLVSASENIQNIDKVKATHEITSVSARFAEYLLEHPEVMHNVVKQIRAGQKLVQDRCKTLHIQAYPSCANFIFLKLPNQIDSGEVVRLLKERKIYIKGPFREIPVDGMIRVTLGPPDQMGIFMDALADIMKELAFATSA